MDIDRKKLGQMLLQRGFRDWFLYMFKAITGKPFIIEPMHEELFAEFQNIYDGDKKRVNINLPPRAGKTTLAKYFVIYVLTNNPKAQIIYTSYSQSLLATISEEIANILEHEIYKALYPQNITQQETQHLNPIDNFWAEYLYQETGENKYSAKKITTYAGGILLFASMGSQITGYGAGLRNADGFTGMLIMDDPQKPADIKSQIMREKALRYFEETLLSRLNNPNVPIICIQQRLHVEDLSGLLEQKYQFITVKFPLLDEHDVCQLPSQYTEERIIELKINNYMFSAQYQQEPIFEGGGVFKHEWWRYYKDINDTQYKRIFITADTANKTKEWNDYTAIGVWGLTIQNRLRLLDLVHTKMEMPELQSTMVALWEKWKMGIGRTRCTAIYVEDKASGTQVIQTLKRQGGLPIMALMPDKDKLERALDCVPQVAAGNVELPENENNQITREFLAELDAFSADMTATHDDLVDMFTYACNTAYSQRGYF